MCGCVVAEVLDEDKMNVELVVQCVRVSDMPQTHHHALLLLGTVASIFPVSATPLWNVSTFVSMLIQSLQFNIECKM